MIKKEIRVGFYATFFAFVTAKSTEKPAVKPIKATPIRLRLSIAIVFAIAIPANVDTITAPINFFAEYESSLPKYPLTVFNTAPDIHATTAISNGSTITNCILCYI